MKEMKILIHTPRNQDKNNFILSPRRLIYTHYLVWTENPNPHGQAVKMVYRLTDELDNGLSEYKVICAIVFGIADIVLVVNWRCFGRVCH